MQIERIDISNFRNIPELVMCPAPGVNVITGDNGQGKTNLLEALQIALTGSSHRHAKLSQLAGDTAKPATVRVMTREGGSVFEVCVTVFSGRKSHEIDGVAAGGMQELARRFPLVVFTPGDLALVQGSPGTRRGFMDSAMSSCSAAYADTLSRYGTVLASKSAALRTGTPSRELLASYDEMLAVLGSGVITARLRFLRELLPLARRAYGMLAGGEDLGISYSCALFSGGVPASLEDAYRLGLSRVATEEARRRICLFGAHRDDMEVSLSGRPARDFASQGQQRSASLALKAALIPLVEGRLSIRPAILLDDVMSELDESRRRAVRDMIGSAQCLVTGAEDGISGWFTGAGVYTMKDGTLKEKPAQD